MTIIDDYFRRERERERKRLTRDAIQVQIVLFEPLEFLLISKLLLSILSG